MFSVKASSHTCSMSQAGTPHTHFQTIVKLSFHKPGIKDFLFFSFSPLFFRHLDALLSAARSKHLYWPFWSVCTDTVAVSVLSWGLTRKQSDRLVRLVRLEGSQTEPGTNTGLTISPLLRDFRGYNISLAWRGWNSWSNLFPSFPAIKLSIYVQYVTIIHCTYFSTFYYLTFDFYNQHVKWMKRIIFFNNNSVSVLWKSPCRNHNSCQDNVTYSNQEGFSLDILFYVQLLLIFLKYSTSNLRKPPGLIVIVALNSVIKADKKLWKDDPWLLQSVRVLSLDILSWC